MSVLLFTLLFGILQYGLYFWSLQSGDHAAREAARHAAVGTTDCATFDSLVQQNAQGVTASFNATRQFFDQSDTTFTTPITDPGVGDNVKVTVSFHSIDIGFPFVPFIDDGLVHQEAIARVENTTPTGSLPCT